MEYNFKNIKYSSGGYGANKLCINIDVAGKCTIERYSTCNELISSMTKEIEWSEKQYTLMQKIVNITSEWNKAYYEPELCDGPEIEISIDDKNTYINSVSPSYYPKHYMKVIKYFNELIEFSGIHLKRDYYEISSL